MRPSGESMKTWTPRLPLSAYSAALPVSPEVAPSTFSVRPRRASSYSKALPRNCIATSLNASVGPFDRPSTNRPGSSAAQRRDARVAEDLVACSSLRRCAAQIGGRDVVGVERR